MAGDSEKPNTSTDIQSLLLSNSCSYNNKRRKTETPPSSSSSSSSEQSSLCLNDLQVNLIEEILARLPTSKSAFLCKCVCKNWYSLISTPYFTRRFITHHLNYPPEQNPSAFFINYWNESSDYGIFTFSDGPMFKSGGFELNYLHQRNGSVQVVATFKDLMLCRVNGFQLGKFQYHYYICNPFTMQWVALPLLESDKDKYGLDAGFICEPYYSQDDKGEWIINSNYRFRVVHFAKVETLLIVSWTYRSETQQWYRSVLEGPEYKLSSNIAAYNGKLLWYSGGDRIFAYDPFNPELSTFISCSYIDPTGFSRFPTRCCIGVCQGFLRMMRLVFFVNFSVLSLWELEDYTSEILSLVCEVRLDSMIYQDSLLHRILGGRCNLLSPPLGFHPSDGAIVYLQFQNSVILGNMRSRELKVIAEVPGTVYHQGRLYNIEPSMWPTPTPERIENLPG